MDVDDGVAANDAVENGFLETFNAGRNVFLRNVAAYDLVFDGDSLAALVGCDLDDDVAVLTAPARLLDEFAFAIRRDKDRFLVRDLRLAGVGLDLEFPEHPVPDDLEVQLSHARDDGLPGFLVCEDAEGWVLFCQALERVGHFLLVELGLRLDGHGDDGIGEGRRFEQDRVILIAKCVAGGDVLDSDDGGDVARVTRVDVFALVRLDLDETADALAFVRARIINRVPFAQLAGINAEEHELADEWVAPQLEGERAELGVVVSRSLHRLACVGVLALGRRNVERARQIIHDRVYEVLHALVLEGRASSDWDKPVRDRLAANGRL